MYSYKIQNFSFYFARLITEKSNWFFSFTVSLFLNLVWWVQSVSFFLWIFIVDVKIQRYSVTVKTTHQLKKKRERERGRERKIKMEKQIPSSFFIF